MLPGIYTNCKLEPLDSFDPPTPDIDFFWFVKKRFESANRRIGRKIFESANRRIEKFRD